MPPTIDDLRRFAAQSSFPPTTLKRVPSLLGGRHNHYCGAASGSWKLVVWRAVQKVPPLQLAVVRAWLGVTPGVTPRNNFTCPQPTVARWSVATAPGRCKTRSRCPAEVLLAAGRDIQGKTPAGTRTTEGATNA